MVGFSKKELEFISGKCGNDFAQRYRGIMKRENEDIVKIVNTGMVSSGKSSLFNILIDFTEEEYFPTGAARTTTAADYFDYKNISFIDTPGIDVKNEDDDLAFRTIMEADLIMIVHNIRTGPINRSEVEWIEKIVKRMNDTEMCKARLMFVCTWKDTREKDEDYLNIIDDVKKQLFEVIGVEIPFFDVSVKKYINGVSRQKEVLKASSGIIELKQYLEEYAIQYLDKKKEMNAEEMRLLVYEIREKLLAERNSDNNQINKIKTNIKDKYKSRRSTWKQVYDFFAMKKQQLLILENEYKNI